MTKEEKIVWLENANNVELINMLSWSVLEMSKGDHVSTRIEGQENYDLITAELLKRLNK